MLNNKNTLLTKQIINNYNDKIKIYLTEYLDKSENEVNSLINDINKILNKNYILLQRDIDKILSKNIKVNELKHDILLEKIYNNLLIEDVFSKLKKYLNIDTKTINEFANYLYKFDYLPEKIISKGDLKWQ